MAELSIDEELELEREKARAGPVAAQPAPQQAPQYERGTILPLKRNVETGDVSFAVPGIVQSGIEALKLPGDVYSGRTQLRDPATGDFTDEAIGRAFELGGLATGADPVSRLARPGAAAPAVPATTRAQREFGNLVQMDDAGDIGQRMRTFGPEAMPMDVSPNIQGQAGSLASRPGRAQSIIRDTIRARDAGANTRIRGAVDETLGPAPLPSAIDETITAGQRALGPEYKQVFQGAQRVDTAPIAETLEQAVTVKRGAAQQLARDVRKMLNVPGTDQLDPDPRTLFETRNAIDGVMQVTADSKAIAFLTDIRKQIDDMLAQAVPGLKDVDARYAELARQSGALQRGQQVLESGRTAPRPPELAREFAEGAIPQGTMTGPSAVPLRLRQGARAEIDRIIGTNANDRVAMQRILKGEGDWNRDRLATLFGKEKADKIIAIVDAERAFADTSQVVTRNSETARRQITNDLAGIGGRSEPGAFQSVGNMRFGDAVKQIGRALGGKFRNRAQARFNTELAEIITSKDPQMIERILGKVETAQKNGTIPATVGREITSLIRNVNIADPRVMSPRDQAQLQLGVRLMIMGTGQESPLFTQTPEGLRQLR